MSTPHQKGFTPSKFNLVINVNGSAVVRIPCQTTEIPEITGDIVLEADKVSLGARHAGPYPNLDKRKNGGSDHA